MRLSSSRFPILNGSNNVAISFSFNQIRASNGQKVHHTWFSAPNTKVSIDTFVRGEQTEAFVQELRTALIRCGKLIVTKAKSTLRLRLCLFVAKIRRLR